MVYYFWVICKWVTNCFEVNLFVIWMLDEFGWGLCVEHKNVAIAINVIMIEKV